MIDPIILTSTVAILAQASRQQQQQQLQQHLQQQLQQQLLLQSHSPPMASARNQSAERAAYIARAEDIRKWLSVVDTLMAVNTDQFCLPCGKWRDEYHTTTPAHQRSCDWCKSAPVMELIRHYRAKVAKVDPSNFEGDDLVVLEYLQDEPFADAQPQVMARPALASFAASSAADPRPAVSSAAASSAAASIPANPIPANPSAANPSAAAIRTAPPHVGMLQKKNADLVQENQNLKNEVERLRGQVQLLEQQVAAKGRPNIMMHASVSARTSGSSGPSGPFNLADNEFPALERQP